MLSPGRNYLLFDGDCGICAWSADLGRKIDRRGVFAIEPYQAFDEDSLRVVGLDYGRCSREVQVITRDGNVHAGAFGINYFFWKLFPWTLCVVLVYALPVLLLVEVITYKLIAANRRRISAWLGLKGCVVAR